MGKSNLFRNLLSIIGIVLWLYSVQAVLADVAQNIPPSVASQQLSSESRAPSIVFPILAPKFSSGFGTRKHPVFANNIHHNGLDIAAPEYSHVRAVLSGVVIFAGVYAGYGKLVSIQHKNGNASVYGHLSEIRVNVGQRVKTGSIIGRIGSTGVSTGPHLHFEWRKNGVSLNPMLVFPSLFKQPVG